MKKAIWILPLVLLAACKNDKPNQSTIFGNGNDVESNELGDSEQQIIDELNQSAQAQNVGNHYTDLELPLLGGGTARLSDYISKNKITVIDCWASWCRPCMEEMPNVARLYRKYHSLGVEVVGISFDEDETAWNSAVKNNDMTWPQLGELKGWDNQMFNVYGVHGIPHTIIVNQKGEIVAENVRGEALINAVAKELSK